MNIKNMIIKILMELLKIWLIMKHILMKDLIRKNIYQKINYILDSLPQIETYDNIVKDKFERIKSTRQRRNEIIAKKTN